MEWPLDTASTGALGTSITLFAGAVATLLKARAKSHEAAAARVEASAKAEVIDAQRENTQTVALANTLKSQQELVRGLMTQTQHDREHFANELAKLNVRAVETSAQLEAQTELNANLAAELATTRRYVLELQAKVAALQTENASLHEQQRGMRATIVQLEGEIGEYRQRIRHLEATLALIPEPQRKALESEAKSFTAPVGRIRSDPPPAVSFARPRPPERR
jgi:chromosome segregation ATPase